MARVHGMGPGMLPTAIEPGALVVLSAAPRGFSGAGIAHRRYLHALHSMGATPVLIGGSVEDDQPEFANDPIQRVTVERVQCEAYPRSDVLGALATAEEMVELGAACHEQGGHVVLLATYLIPFGWAAATAGAILASRGIPVRVVLVPAGSDVWEAGSRLKACSTAILTDPNVSHVVTYSRRFADEVRSLADGLCQPVVIPPMVNPLHFRICTASERESHRQRLGIERHAFVLVNCSNMRPVKDLQTTLCVALALSDRIVRGVTLLLVGPITSHLRSVLTSILDDAAALESPATLRVGRLRIIVAGSQADPRPFYWASDVALNTSIHDSFNMSLAEAMACGRPMVSTDTVGLAELPGVGDCSYLFPTSTGAIAALRGGLPPTPAPAAQVEAAAEWISVAAGDSDVYRHLALQARYAIETALRPEVVGGMWSALLNQA